MRRLQHSLAPVATINGPGDSLLTGDYSIQNGEIVYCIQLDALMVYRTGTGIIPDGITTFPCALGPGIWEIVVTSGFIAVAGGDLSGNYPNPTVNRVHGATVPAAGALIAGQVLQVLAPSTLTYALVAPTSLSPGVAGQVLVQGATPAWANQSAITHGNLSGLAADDHPQYLLASGARPLTADWNAGAANKITVGTLLVDSGSSGVALVRTLVGTPADGAVYTGPAAGAPSATNYTLAGDGTNSGLNAATGGTAGLRVAGATIFSVTAAGASANNLPIANVASPSAATDAANKAYVDAAAAGLVPKTICQVVSIANQVLSGLPTIDTITLLDSQRALLTAQVNPVEDGPWLVHAGAWTRPADFAAGSHAHGAYMFIAQGSRGGTSWVCTTLAPNDVVDANSLAFVQFSAPVALTAGNGISILANVISAVSGDASITVGVGGITVGVISDAQHGARSGGTTHALANNLSNGFAKLLGGVANMVLTTTDGSTQTWGTVADAMIAAVGWAKVTGTPTTLAGYGITDAVPNTRAVNTVAPLTGGGALSVNRTLGITQATAGTDGYLTQADFQTFAAKMTNPMVAVGDIIVGNVAGAPSRLAVGTATQVLHGGTSPGWSSVVEADLSLSAVTTGNATGARHGFLPQLSGTPGQFLDGTGSWSTPAGMTSAYTSVAYAGVASKNVIHNFGAYPAVQCIDSTGLVFTPTSVTHNTLNDFTVVFTGLSTGTIVATLGSPQAQSVVTSAISLNLSNTNRVVEMTTAGTTATLPTAVGRTGREFIIDNASTGNINVASLGGTIEGEVAQVVPPSSALVVYSDGTNWRLW